MDEKIEKRLVSLLELVEKMEEEISIIQELIDILVEEINSQCDKKCP